MMSDLENRIEQDVDAIGALDADATNRLSLMICKAFSGEIFRINVSMYETVNEALPIIADTIAYYSPDWERIGLYNLSQDFEYLADDRFIDRGTREGDLVVIADGAAAHK
ncbi:MAG: hypothetical protein H7X80_09980 [bacterium]|nr:hypothetical protein [Candidatus Kapabacteria bacterium]